MKITTGIVTQDRDIAADTDFMSVPWQIVDDEMNVLLEGNQGFPLSTTEDEVRNFLQAKLMTYQANVVLHEGAKELQAGIDNATEVSGNISNISVE
jgi:hypothetical protein